MTNTTAKARLLELLIEPLKGCKGLYTHRQDLMDKVMRMPDLEVRDHLNRLRASHYPGTWWRVPSQGGTFYCITRCGHSWQSYRTNDSRQPHRSVPTGGADCSNTRQSTWSVQVLTFRWGVGPERASGGWATAGLAHRGETLTQVIAMLLSPCDQHHRQALRRSSTGPVIPEMVCKSKGKLHDQHRTLSWATQRHQRRLSPCTVVRRLWWQKRREKRRRQNNVGWHRLVSSHMSIRIRPSASPLSRRKLSRQHQPKVKKASSEPQRCNIMPHSHKWGFCCLPDGEWDALDSDTKMGRMVKAILSCNGDELFSMLNSFYCCCRSEPLIIRLQGQSHIVTCWQSPNHEMINSHGERLSINPPPTPIQLLYVYRI